MLFFINKKKNFKITFHSYAPCCLNSHYVINLFVQNIIINFGFNSSLTFLIFILHLLLGFEN